MPFSHIRKGTLAALIALLLLASGCMRLVPERQTTEEFEIYTSFYPLYAFTELATQGIPGVHVHCLVQPQDGCLRSYELSDWDLYLLRTAPDLMVIGGRGLESFESELYTLGTDGPAVLTAFSGLTLVNDGKTNNSEEASHWDTENPHIYLSVSGARSALAEIIDGLSQLMPMAIERLTQNLETAGAKLDELLAEMRAAAPDAAGQKVFLLNEALYYTVQDFDLDVDGYYARESGQALADSEFERCLEKLRSTEAKLVLVEKQAPESLTTRLEAEGYRVARIDILAEGRGDLGADGYFAAQRANASALGQALLALNEN